jgi:hypothetical protein
VILDEVQRKPELFQLIRDLMVTCAGKRHGFGFKLVPYEGVKKMAYNRPNLSYTCSITKDYNVS